MPSINGHDGQGGQSEGSWCRDTKRFLRPKRMNGKGQREEPEEGTTAGFVIADVRDQDGLFPVEETTDGKTS